MNEWTVWYVNLSQSSYKKEKETIDAVFLFQSISHKKVGRKEDRKQGEQSTYRIHGMNKLKTFDYVRDHSIWFDKRSFDSVSYFYWWGNRPEEWKYVYLESYTRLPVTPKPSFYVLFVWFCFVCVGFLFFKYIVMIFISINSIINKYWCLKRHIVSKSKTE